MIRSSKPTEQLPATAASAESMEALASQDAQEDDQSCASDDSFEDEDDVYVDDEDESDEDGRSFNELRHRLQELAKDPVHLAFRHAAGDILVNMRFENREKSPNILFIQSVYKNLEKLAEGRDQGAVELLAASCVHEETVTQSFGGNLFLKTKSTQSIVAFSKAFFLALSQTDYLKNEPITAPHELYAFRLMAGAAAQGIISAHKTQGGLSKFVKAAEKMWIANASNLPFIKGAGNFERKLRINAATSPSEKSSLKRKKTAPHFLLLTPYLVKYKSTLTQSRVNCF